MNYQDILKTTQYNRCFLIKENALLSFYKRRYENGLYFLQFIDGVDTTTGVNIEQYELTELDTKNDNWTFCPTTFFDRKVVCSDWCEKMKCGYTWNQVIHIYNGCSLMLLRHEWGHTIQYRQLGRKKFIATIWIPSLLSYIYDKITKQNKHMSRSFEKEATNNGYRIYELKNI